MGAHLTAEKVRHMAYIFSVTGNYHLVGQCADRNPTAARNILRDHSCRKPEIRKLVQTGYEVAREKGIANGAMHRRRPEYVIRNDLALKRHREIHAMRAEIPSPITLGQQLLGEPLPGRSAAEDIETDGRGNIAKRGPVRVNVGAINIPDIRINNNGHHA